MGRFWSLVFWLVPVFGVLMFVWPLADLWPLQGYWLPVNINDYGQMIDSLFMFILYLTGVIFIGTSAVLAWFMWRYDGKTNRDPVIFTHGSHTVEIVWSILPAATLLFIAIYQMNAWADAKLRRPVEVVNGQERLRAPLAQVLGRQFEWRIKYAGADGILHTTDDIHTVNELHVPVNEDVVLEIGSTDVLHSFFLPQMRVKQDVVPGMKQFVWFRANREGVYDIVCAELCGWGHYKMRGRLTTQNRSDFDTWLAQELREQNRSEFIPATGDTSDE